MNMHKESFILLFQCSDKRGIVARVSDFILKHDGNIITADQYTTDPQNGCFFMRVEFMLDRSHWNKDSLTADFAHIATEFNAEFEIYDKKNLLKMGVFVSRPDHCLFELLYLWKSRELNVEIPFVASNWEPHRELVESYKIPFYFIPATKKDRKESELLKLASEKSDFLVLARYMLVLSGQFLTSYNKDIINIHHGFLPSFKGANPYKQAFDEGVKVIGATAHFVTERLDEGPIITQAVEYVSHTDSVESLISKGKNLEKHALADAVLNYIDYRIIKHKNKTIVFIDT